MDIYEIISNTDNRLLYNYVIIIIIIIFLFNSTSLSSSAIVLIIVVLFYGLYNYHHDVKNILTFSKKQNIKYDEIDKNYKNTLIDESLKNYPDIVNYLFYLYPYEQYNKSLYNDIVNYFYNFVSLYKNSETNKKNIIYNYNEMVLINNKIIIALDNFVLMDAPSDKIRELKIQAQKIIDKYLLIIITKYKKQLYYNGYDITTKILENDDQYAFNYFDIQNQNIRGTEIITLQNLLSA
jgi:hypothetical protein